MNINEITATLEELVVRVSSLERKVAALQAAAKAAASEKSAEQKE